MRLHRRLVGVLAIVFSVALVAAACGGRQAETGQEKKQLKIAYINWDENIAVSHLYQALLQDKGYQVQLTELDAGPVYAGLAKGDNDLFLDAWLPSTHADYWAQYKNNLEDLGVWYDQATLNIAVPNYVQGINSIADLKGKASQFGGHITGIDPGAGETRIARDKMMPAYGLSPEYSLQVSSSTAMLAALDSAVKEQKPIVVTIWHPHWAYAKYPLKDLADPQKAMGDAEQLHSIGRKGFTQDFPQVAEMTKKLRLNDKQLADLENTVNSAQKGQETQAAKQWADKNPDVVNAFASAVK